MNQILLRLTCAAALAVVVVACTTSTDSGAANATSSTGQRLAVGAPCTGDAQCGSAPFFCMLEHPGGYCMRKCDIAKGDVDCPSEAICQFDGEVGECHAKCDSAAGCRSGYACSPASMSAGMKASHAFCDMGESSDGGIVMDGMTGMPGMDR